MKTVTRMTIHDEAGRKFFGEGPARLMAGIEETGSLRAAAASMEMAYSKALTIMKNAEEALGLKLIERTTGGKSGGGSALTIEGKAWLSRYRAYRAACEAANERLFRQFFPEVGCVIMASGMGARFGGNKLLADFDGKPMILWALQASEGMRRVVVTRHADVARLCREAGVDVIEHDLPLRSDTIRLGLEKMKDMDGCMFLPGDQPLLTRETVSRLVNRFREEPGKILRPCCNETPGSPVIFPKWAFGELMSLPQGKGGSWVIASHPEKMARMQIDDPHELMDADTKETLQTLLQHRKGMGR